MTDSGEVTVVGTSHVSERSAERVREAIRETEPDVVAVELDSSRYDDVRDLVGRDPGYGVDMATAIEEAERLDVPVALVDRDVDVTVRRIWSEMSLFERIRAGVALAASALGLGRSAGEIDDAVEEGRVQEYVDELREFTPGGARALIDERDAYMASRLLDLSENGDVVAVVGAGHEAGLERYLESGEAPDVPASLGVESADYDLLVSEDEVVALVDLPGCEDGDVDVRMESGVLHVEARRRPTLEPGYRRVSGGSPPPLEAEIRVPSAVDAESASASFDGGVLRVRLPQI